MSTTKAKAQAAYDDAARVCVWEAATTETVRLMLVAESTDYGEDRAAYEAMIQAEQARGVA